MTGFVRPRALAAPAVRLVAFHHAGGSASAYFPMSRYLPADWDLALLDLPGRGKRVGARPYAGMAAVLDQALHDLAPLRDAPIALFGHSMGAIVAWEVARAWTAADYPPVWVGLSGRQPPQWRTTVPGGLYRLDDDALLAQLAALGGVPAWLHETPEFRQRFLDLVRADLTAVDSYRPDPGHAAITRPLAAYGGVHDPWVPPDAMAAWSDRTTGPFQLRMFPGGHFYFGGPALPEFMARLVDDISSVMTICSPIIRRAEADLGRGDIRC